MATILFYLQSHRRFLLHLAIICGLLVGAPVVGVLVARINPVFVFIALAAPLGLVGLQLVLPRFDLSPLFILFAAAFVPIALPTGTESKLVDSFLLTMLFVGNWFLKMIIVEKRFSLKPSPVNKPLLGFMFVILFSLVWSWVFKDPLVDPAKLSSKFIFVQIASALTMIMLPGAFLLVANHINDVKWLKIMVAIMLVAGVLAVAGRYAANRPIIVNDGGLFTMWITVLGIGLGLFYRELSWKWRGLLLVLGSAAIFFRFVYQITWLAGWLPPVVALGTLTFMRSKKLFLIILLLGTMYVALNADYYLGEVIEAETNESGHTRLAAWEVNWRVTGKHLLFGTGPAGYAVYYMNYFPNDAMATHNNVMDILAQTGVVGLALCLWFFFALAWLGYKLCLRLKGRGDFSEGLANAVFAGTISCIVAMIIGDWLFPFTYTQTIAGFDYVVYSWLFMGAILVLDRLIQSKPEAMGETLALKH